MKDFGSLTRGVRRAAVVAGFVRRHGRLTALVVVVAMLAIPLVRGGDVGAFALNALGLGLCALVLRRLLRWRLRRMPRR